MPKGRKNGKGNRGKSPRSRTLGFENDGRIAPGGLDRVSRVNGKAKLAMTTSSNVIQFPLSTQIDNKLQIMSTLYELYRFRWVKFTLHPSDNSTSNEQAIGFLPDRPTAVSSPTSISDVLELAYSKYIAAREIDPIWIAVNAVGLLGRTALKWWDTDTTSTESTVQGRIFAYTGQAAVVLNIILEYEVEFCNPIPTSVTLIRLQRSAFCGSSPRVGKDHSGLPVICSKDEGEMKEESGSMSRHTPSSCNHSNVLKCACGSCQAKSH